jgi:hypothetical protein
MNIKRPFDTDLDSYIAIDAEAKLLDANKNALQQYKAIPFVGTDVFQPLSVIWKWKEAAYLEISFRVEYKIIVTGVVTMIKAIGKGTYKVSVPWQINYTDSGITLQPEGEQDLGSGGEGNYAVELQVKQNQSPPEATERTAFVLVRLIGGFSEDGIGVSVGPFSAGGTGSAQKNSKDYVLKVFCYAGGKPEKAVSVPEALLSHTAPFAKDERYISSVQLDRLEDKWLEPLQERAPELYDAIKNGRCTLNLTGYASTTGTNPYNLKLTEDRIRSVEQALRNNYLRIDGKSNRGLKIATDPRGKADAAEEGEVPAERRVQIWIRKQDAVDAMSQSNKNKSTIAAGQ